MDPMEEEAKSQLEEAGRNSRATKKRDASAPRDLIPLMHQFPFVALQDVGPVVMSFISAW